MRSWYGIHPNNFNWSMFAKHGCGAIDPIPNNKLYYLTGLDEENLCWKCGKRLLEESLTTFTARYVKAGWRHPFSYRIERFDSTNSED